MSQVSRYARGLRPWSRVCHPYAARHVYSIGTLPIPAYTELAICKMDARDLTIGLVTHTAGKALSAPLTFPIQRAVTLLQSHGAGSARGAPSRPFTGFFNVISQTTASLGFAANYRGLAFSLCSAPLAFGCSKLAKDGIKAMLPRYSTKDDFFKYAATQAASSALGPLVALPVELPLRWSVTLAQADLRAKSARLGGLGHLKRLARAPGGAATCCALQLLPVTALGIILQRGVQLGLYDTLNAVNPPTDGGLRGLSSTVGNAVVCAAASELASYPCRLVATRLMVENAARAPGQLIGVMECVRSARANGGLYRGILPALCCGAPGGVVILLAYDSVKNWLQL